jgi:hypothetical protein
MKKNKQGGLETLQTPSQGKYVLVLLFPFNFKENCT